MNPIKFEDFESKKHSITVVGLGYVGLPLAALLSRRFKVHGLDIHKERVIELKNGLDRTRELSTEQLQACAIEYTCDPRVIRDSRLIIVTVPTPIDRHKNPDLTPLIKASAMIGENLTAGSTVVYESTV